MPHGASVWEGYYEPESPRQAMLRYADILTGGEFVDVDSVAVHVRPLFGKPRTLIPVGTNLFRTENGAAAGTIFTTDENESVVMVLTCASEHPGANLFCEDQSHLADDASCSDRRRVVRDADLGSVCDHLDSAQDLRPDE